MNKIKVGNIPIHGKLIMEEELNIANILKDKPSGTKLYADAFGELKLERVKVNEEDIIHTRSKILTLCLFYSNGKFAKDGEPILVPSKKMRDWNKFAWKPGDVLVNRDKNMHLIFEKFTDDTYTIFAGKYCYEKDFRNEYNLQRRFDSFMTEYFTLETDDADVQTYFRAIENKLGGKLNRETLEIEKQPKFKDGDIICVTDGNEPPTYIVIYKKQEDNHIYRYATVVKDKCIGMDDGGYLSCAKNSFKRYATDSEKQQLFDALAKEGKTWDVVKKQIVDLKSKWNPKPFDRVVTRVDDDAIWTANIFSHIDSYGEYNTIGCVGGYPYCLPYNEETAKLIGTTKEWKE